MKPFQTAVCAALLTLGCVTLTACGSPNGSANKPEESETIVETVGPVAPPPAQELPAPHETLPKRAQYLLVRVNGLNVRSGQSTGYSSLGSAQEGELLELVSRTGNWYETRYRGRTAYISADARYTEPVSFETNGDKIERVIAEGANVLGVPYVYGATRLHDGKGNPIKGFTTAKFDCSSLMQYAFYKGAGVLLDVNTRTQVSQGETVAKNEIKRGDLLFFTNASRKNNTGLERIGHVALYLGDNYILHTASDYAKIEQISPTRWGYFITAKRVL